MKSRVIAYVPAGRGIKRSVAVEASERVEQLLREGAARLRARSSAGARGVDDESLVARMRATLEKYLLRDHGEAPAEEVERFLDGLRADDLLLVLACERGDESAWHDMMNGYRTTVLSAARSAVRDESEAEDLAQSVWADLYGLRTRAADGRPAGKLAYYSGCGSLGGWLRAVVGQLAVDRHRRTARLVQTEEPSDFDRLPEAEGVGDGFRPTPAPDPERALFESEAARSVSQALAQSIAGLADEDRLLVRLYYLDGLRLKEAGAVLGVHEATASRRLTRVHGEVRRSVEEILVAERGWTRAEVASTLAEAASHMETDLSALVAPQPAAERGEGVYE
jgi:RNA polymerase sigma-70 factor